MLYLIFGTHGGAAIHYNIPRPTRDDVIKYENKKDKQEFGNSILWNYCPNKFRPLITNILQGFWNCFIK